MIVRTALLAVLLSTPSFAQSNYAWQSVGTPALSDWATICTRIAVDPNGNAYVAYQDLTPGLGARVTVMRNVGNAWQVAGVKGGASTGAGYYCNMAFDAQGGLLVSSRDYGLGGRAGVRRYDPGTSAWSTVGGGIGPGEAHWVDLALTQDGKPCVAYADLVLGNRATAMRYDAGAWSPLGPAGFSSASAGFQKIAVASNGTIYAAYNDNSYPDAANVGKASVRQFNPANATWEYVGAPGFTTYGASNLTLALDRTGTPWIAYYRYHSLIEVWRFDGTNWIKAPGSPTGADVPTVDTEEWRQWLSLQFDSQNRPYIAYQLYYQGGRAAVRRLIGNDWSLVGQWGFTPGAADYLSMVVDAQDVPWVAYRDGVHGQRASVMRFVRVAENYCTAATNSQGCVSPMSSTGAPSLSGATPFVLRANSILNNSNGVLLFGFQAAAVPFGSSFLCVGSFQRTAILNSGGTGSSPNCTGVLQYDFAAQLQSAMPGVWIGTTLYAQYWYRDTLAASGFALTDGLRFTVGP
ncbi:MAG: hypothetical protein JNL28_09995 [Planctomycetes bacterium]|nr:hypothetical protein [Planctomycetota bacterium]